MKIYAVESGNDHDESVTQDTLYVSHGHCTKAIEELANELNASSYTSYKQVNDDEWRDGDEYIKVVEHDLI